MARPTYPSDVSDEAWALLHPLVPEAEDHPGKKPIDRREIMNAIFYVVRTGVQWRYLPRNRSGGCQELSARLAIAA